MFDLLEFFGRCGTHPLGRRVAAFEMREACFNREIALGQSIIVRVRNLRIVVLIIAPVVPGDLIGEALEFKFGLVFGQILNGLLPGRAHDRRARFLRGVAGAGAGSSWPASN